MLLERRALADPAALVREIRALAPAPPSVRAAVAGIVAAVAAEGDAAVRRFTARTAGSSTASASPGSSGATRWGGGGSASKRAV